MFSKGASVLVAVLGLALVLAACQSSGTDALEDVAAGSPMTTETFGDGATALALLLPRSASGVAGRDASDMRDAAALALDDLGAGKLAITVHDTGAGAGAIARLADQLAEAKLILGPMGPQAVSALMALPGRPAALVFGNNGGPHGQGIFALETDAVDSALEAARIAIAAGHTSFAAIVPQAFAQSDRARLSKGLEAAGVSSIEFVTYSGTRLAAELAAERDRLVRADALIVFGEGALPASIASALRQTAALSPKAVLIGNLSWAAENFSRPELEGALVAMPDQTALTLVAERYRAKTGRALSLQAAYGYDAVAVPAGIVRAFGAEALTGATLTKPSGFRGATGIFRFRPDGSIERQLALYQIRNRSLQLVEAAPEGF